MSSLRVRSGPARRTRSWSRPATAPSTARRRTRLAWQWCPISPPQSSGLCGRNSGGRLRGDMEPPPAGSGACALALLALLLPSTLPAQHTRPPAAPKGTISVGATIHDSLARRDVLLTAESTYAQEWRLAGTTGQIVTIDLASEAFDAFVFLLGPGLEKPLQDDDSGGAHRPGRLQPLRRRSARAGAAGGGPDSRTLGPRRCGRAHRRSRRRRARSAGRVPPADPVQRGRPLPVADD